MSLDIRAGTTPLSSRQNPIIYAVLLIALVIIAVCAAVWFLMLMKKKTEENPEWIEAEKKTSDKTQRHHTAFKTLCNKPE